MVTGMAGTTALACRQIFNFAHLQPHAFKLQRMPVKLKLNIIYPIIHVKWMELYNDIPYV